MYTKFWTENLKERDCLENLGVDNIKMDLERIVWESCTGLIRLSIRTNGVFL
jgi:hypothetical protein